MTSSARIEDLHRKYEENPGRYFVALAEELRRSGEPGRAAILCETHLLNMPGHLSGHVVLGRSLADLGDIAGAERAFSAAVELDPENVVALRALGDISRHRVDTEGARGWYQRALEVDPRDPELATRMANLDSPAGTDTPHELRAVDESRVTAGAEPGEGIAGPTDDTTAEFPVASDAEHAAADHEEAAPPTVRSAMDDELSEQLAATEFTAGFFAAVLRGATAEEPAGTEVAQPDSTAPEAAAPPAADAPTPVDEMEQAAPPEVAAEALPESELSEPEVAEPEVADLDLAELDLAGPDVAEPEVARPGVAELEDAEQDVAEPDVAEPIGPSAPGGFSWSLDIAPVAEIPPRPAEPAAAERTPAEPTPLGSVPDVPLSRESVSIGLASGPDEPVSGELAAAESAPPEPVPFGQITATEPPALEALPPYVEVAEEFTDTLPDESDLLRQIAMLEADLEREVNERRGELPDEERQDDASDLDEPPTGGEGSTLPDEETDHFFDDLPNILAGRPTPVSAERVPNDLPAADDERATDLRHGSATPFVTATMATLLVQQGFHADALEVYRQLARQHPADHEIAARVEELEARLAGSHAATGEPNALGWLRELASAQPDVPEEAASQVTVQPADRASDALVWDDLWGEEVAEPTHAAESTEIGAGKIGVADVSTVEVGPERGAPVEEISLEALAARPVGAEDEAAAGALVAATLAMQGDEELDEQLAEATDEDPGSLTRLLASPPASAGRGVTGGGITFSFEQFFQPMDNLPAAGEGIEPGRSTPARGAAAVDEDAAAREADLAEFNEWLTRLSES